MLQQNRLIGVLLSALPLLLSLHCLLGAGVGPEEPRSGKPADRTGQDALKPIQAKLLKEFDGWLDDPQRYKELVETECRRYFPEGDLFPYVFPVFAYTNLAVKDPDVQPKAAKRVAQLIDLAIPEVTRRVRPPGGKLENLKRFNKHATYLGQLNVALGCYRLIGGGERYDKIHKRLSELLHKELVERGGRSLESFPDYSWPFDTIPCLLSLHLYDLHTGESRSKDIIGKHLTWVQNSATDGKTRLPFSRIDNATGRGREAPRGCDLSLRICLQRHIAPEYTAELFAQYVKSFWRERDLLVGFAEWPRGKTKREDADSGPIIQGIGMAATGLGLGATIACGDKPRLRQLCRQTAAMKTILQTMLLKDRRTGRLMIRGKIPYRQGCVTGFVFGDACLFYASTWTLWERP